MKSKTKSYLTQTQIELIFDRACMANVKKVQPINTGEYNTIYSVSTEDNEYILKIAPLPDADVMSYEKDLMQSEVYWYKQMRDNTDIRVPKVYYADFSAKLLPNNYFIMEKLEGTPLTQADLTKEQKADCEDILTQIIAKTHTITNDKFGYIQNALYDNWYKALRSFVVNAIEDCKRKNQKSPRGLKLLKYIDKYSSILEGVECCMVNFDLWFGNLICRQNDGKMDCACIDPERSFWGDRMMDIIYLEPMQGKLEKKEKAIKVYNEIAKEPIKYTYEERIRFALAEGYLGLIVETEKYYRYSPLHFGWWRNVLMSKWYFHHSFRVLKRGTH